jgi:TonB family protein
MEIQYPPSILEDVTKLVMRVQTFTGATGAAIALREGEEMVCRGSRGNNAPDVGMTLSMDGSFTGLAVTGMKAVRCDDTENDSRVDPEISRALRIKSMAVVPVLSGMRVSGVIATFSSAASAFSDTHMAVLKTMADGLGATIQRWLESQGISTGAPSASASVAVAPPAPPRAQAPLPPPPQPRVEAPRPPAPPAPKVEPARPAAPPPPAPRVEAPKPAPQAPPKVEPPAARPAAAAAAATAPAVEKAPEPKPQPQPLPQPKRQEQKQQGKWKPVTPPKQEEEAVETKPVAKPEPKAQPKPEPKPEPRPQPKAEPMVASAPSFSYDAKSDDSEGKKNPMVIGGIVAAVLVVAIGGYFMFGRSSKPAASSAPTTASQPAQPAPSTTAATTAPATAAPTTANSKQDQAKPSADKGKPQPTQVADTTAKPTQAPMIVAPTPSAGGSQQQQADVAPPTIALSGGAGPALDVPATTSAPKLSAPAPANAVIVPSRLIQRINPTYPANAKQYRIEGAVTLSATIGSDGRVHDAKVISGPPMLRDSAVNAVKQWKYTPSTVNGHPVESSVNVVLQFKMPN